MNASTILGHAAVTTQKKPTKNEAFNLMRKLADKLPDDHEQDLIRLFQFFTPATPAKPKSIEQWVAKFAGVRDPRYYLNAIYVEDGTMVASGGYYLATITTEWENGWYDPKTLAPLPSGHTYHWKYPNWQMPNIDTMSVCAPVDLSTIETAPTELNKKPATAIKLVSQYEQASVWVNLEFYKKVISFDPSGIWYVRDNETAAIYKTDAATAILMPVRITEE